MAAPDIRVLTVQMPSALYEELTKAAAETGNSMASIVRSTLAQTLNPKKHAQTS